MKKDLISTLEMRYINLLFFMRVITTSPLAIISETSFPIVT